MFSFKWLWSTLNQPRLFEEERLRILPLIARYLSNSGAAVRLLQKDSRQSEEQARLGAKEEDLALPFAAADSFDFPSGRALDSINYATVHILQSLRTQNHPCAKLRHPDSCMFSELPVEIVLEILPRMHPLDLFHLSRVNRWLRAVLLSKEAESIWRDVFRTQDKLPRCPPLVLTRHWVGMLFGAHICEVCGAPGAILDSDIWRRVCSRCIPESLAQEIPRYNAGHDIYSLIIRIGPSRDVNNASLINRFWLADGLRLARLYECRQAKGSEAFEDFLKFRKTMTLDFHCVGGDFRHWREGILWEGRSKSFRSRFRIMDQIKKHLLAAGYHPHDVEVAVRPTHDLIYKSPNLYCRKRLTKQLWRIIRPQIVSWLTTAENARLERDRSGLSRRRLSVVTACAFTALRSASANTPSYERYAPPYGYDLSAFMPFTRVINQDSKKEMWYAPYRLADEIKAFSLAMDNWNAETRKTLARSLPRTARRAHGNMMDHATSVFICCEEYCEYPIAISWAELRAHLGWCTTVDGVHRSSLGYTAARRLVVLLGLDPETTTDAQMDSIDARFLCEDCPVAPPGRLPGGEALRWRECVQHALECNRHDRLSHAYPRWALLSDRITLDIRRDEARGEIHIHSINAWACIICDEHLPRSHETYAEVMKHIRAEHGVMLPRKGVHLVFFVNKRRRKRQPVILAEGEHATKYECNRCAAITPDKTKLLSLRAILRHIPDKHYLRSAGADDYTEFEQIVARNRYLD
ncbi:hypothetical protein DFH06DRAFT_345969 [Mycena polygramma]|nr:hypothetical protein DFH06DRAFT_345969 [Mycena polygramma]